MRNRTRVTACVATAVMLAGSPIPAAQAPVLERVSFDEAVRRAVERNPSAAVAAAGILRADALLREARAAALPLLSASVTTTTLNEGREFDEQVVVPRSQVASSLDLSMPLFAPALWARRAQARDVRGIADLSAAESRRQTALATADAYLSIIARRRVVEGNERARDVARAHFDLAHQRQIGGTGSLLNELRAQQELSSDEVLVESARFGLYRAQEALGVLLAADGPVDAGDEPGFDVPSGSPEDLEGSLLQRRADLKLFSARVSAADRVVRDSRRDYLPVVQGLFQPQALYPSQIFQPSRSWRALLQLSLPVFDSGQRAGLRQERQALLNESRATLTGAVTQARSELRAAREAVQSADRGLQSARAAADQAQRVVEIVNVSYRAGAATNIEVIDAERRARDADTTVAVAEDTLRRARLDLLTAAGRFP